MLATKGQVYLFLEPQFQSDRFFSLFQALGVKVCVLDPLGVFVSPGPRAYEQLMENLGQKNTKMPIVNHLCFTASPTPSAQGLCTLLKNRFGNSSPEDADVIVVVGGWFYDSGYSSIFRFEKNLFIALIVGMLVF